MFKYPFAVVVAVAGGVGAPVGVVGEVILAIVIPAYSPGTPDVIATAVYPGLSILVGV